MRPELFGPIIVAGAPLSYWSGVRGANPMRYTGGLVGGSWMAALASDLGNGTFDGASLVQNFENLNPANTLWKKQYNLYSRIDTEAPRYLEFEKYWDTPTRLTAGGDPVHRRPAVRRQQAQHGGHRHQRRNAGGPARHPFAHRRVLLEGR